MRKRLNFWTLFSKKDLNLDVIPVFDLDVFAQTLFPPAVFFMLKKCFSVPKLLFFLSTSTSSSSFEKL